MTELFSSGELFGLITASARKNGKEGLRGFLLFSNGRFLQLLEGPSKALSDLYRVIEQDPRHRDCEIVYDTSVETTSFSNWSMRRIPSACPNDAREFICSKANGSVPEDVLEIVDDFLEGALNNVSS